MTVLTRHPAAETTTPLGYTLTLKPALSKVPGTLGRMTTAIGAAGGDIDAIDLIETQADRVLRAVAVVCQDDRHARRVVSRAVQAAVRP